MTANNPIEVARETLKILTARKLQPTPDNFERVYHEIAQIKPDQQRDKLAPQLLRTLEALPTEHPDTKPLLIRFRHAMESGRIEQLPQYIVDFFHLQASRQGNQPALAEPWGTLLLRLIRLWELRQANLSQNHKRTALERLLINFGNEPLALNEKLHALLDNWSQPLPRADLELESSETSNNHADSIDAASYQTFQQCLALILAQGVAPRVMHLPALATLLQIFLDELPRINSPLQLEQLLPRLRSFLIKLELQNQQDERLSQGLASLLSLLLENIAELNSSDTYLSGQVAAIQQLLQQHPLSMQHIYQLEIALKEVIAKQGQLKNTLDEAASSLRQLLDSFLARLASMTDSTDEFHSKITGHSQRIRSAQDMVELGEVVNSLIADTSAMQLNLTRSRTELNAAHEQVLAAELRIRELEKTLEETSAKVREDQLTGAYNRQGLIEHMSREINRAERSGLPLCLALLDVDNFKQLNDRYGHLAGDDVLRYLVNVTRNNLRPADIVARFGGEEFIILLPETPLDEAIQTIQRLQRELTKTFFLANNDRLVVTFSAGVALWHMGEEDADVIDRADQAMYRAKLAGKNRVCSAEDDSITQPA